MDIDYNKIGAQVKKYRKMREMSQEQLAEAAEISSKHVSGIENGRTKMSVDCLIRIADVLEITPDHLIIDYVKNQQAILDEEWAELVHECTVAEQKKFLKYFRAFVDIERG